MDLEFKYLFEMPDAIPLIASWYFDEWQIPQEKSIASLQLCMTDRVPLQLLCLREGAPVATGGLYPFRDLGLARVEERFRDLDPWLALLYTVPQGRGLGIGARLCERFDEEVRRLGLDRYYLYTFTAEGLYRRLGWKERDRITYKGNDTAVMYRDLINKEIHI